MKIHAISALSDNYIWVIQKDNQAIVIDPAVSDKVLEFLKDNHLSLLAIWLTHEHNDHIGGVAGILEYYPNTPIYCHSTHYTHNNVMPIENDNIINLFNQQNVVHIYKTAGHTANHLTFLFKDDKKLTVFCGDTLFSGGCGRVFTGTIDELYQSFRLFDNLDKTFDVSDNDIYFYPAHEYTLSNLKFGQYIEPNNLAIQNEIAHINNNPNQITLPTSLNKERQINVFLRVTQNTVKNALLEKGLTNNIDDELLLFSLLRQAKNTF